ncbi:hypothetical protein L1787_15380 [Acuticoccus sp. M5D2P5]|uniref:ring-opening amidohydrolase n=1 Tax=Acuticoccus kalidii TaxID=2910977 RepID=UPI001F2DAA67|nr:hypothetical protein [Acuticoccus kalidii]
MTTRLHVWSPASPDDMSGLEAALAELDGSATNLCVFGKVEGPATLNDYARHLAVARCEETIRAHGGPALLARTFRLFSTGCEGIATPVMALLADVPDDTGDIDDAPRLVFGAARSAPVPLADRAGLAHIEATAATVEEALAAAGLSPDDAALVLVKSPVLPISAETHPERRRHAGSTGSSRGAGALGVALALGETEIAALGEDPVGRSPEFSRRAMVYSGTEADCVEVLVLGERPGAGGDLRIATALLADLLDTPAAAALAADTGAAELVLFKAGIGSDGRLRGRRTTVFGSDLTADKQLRAAASGAIGAWFGTTAAFISGGAEHQGPDGACLAAAIYSTLTPAER